MLTSPHHDERVRSATAVAAAGPWDPPTLPGPHAVPSARLSALFDARPWLLTGANIVAAALFVAGSVAFYWPALHIGSVTVFLAGSVLFMFGALGSALVERDRRLPARAEVPGRRRGPRSVVAVRGAGAPPDGG